MKLFITISCAIAAFVDRLRGRELALNEALVAPAPESVPVQALTGADGQPIVATAPVVTVGVPGNLDPKKVLERKMALIKAGTEPLIAEKLAIDAESQQALRDQGLAAELKLKQVPVTAQVADLTVKPDGSTEGALEDKTVDQLKELAASRKVEITSGMKKADIIAALQGGAAQVIAVIGVLFISLGSFAQAATVKAADAETTAQSVPTVQTTAPISLASEVAIAPNELSAPAAVDINREEKEWIAAAILLAFAACAYLPKAYRSWGGFKRYLKWLMRDPIERFRLRMRRALFLLSLRCRAFLDLMGRRALAANATPLTPTEVDALGIDNLQPDAAIAYKNALVKKGSDDRHFAATGAATDIPYGILLNDEVDAADVGSPLNKGIAVLGLYPGSIPCVSDGAAAILAGDLIVASVATAGNVKKLPATPGAYYVIGRSRFAVAATASDPVSLEHCTPYLHKVGVGYVTGDGGAVVQITSSATGVTLNKLCGQITTVALTTAAGAEERFTVTDSQIAAGDTVSFGTTYNGAGTPMIGAINVTAGTFDIVITNLHASNALNALMVINFAIVKAVAA